MSREKGKLIKDAVHGYISLHPLCVSITNTPQFQRLRYLKQLGVTYFVYPAAAHNRYEHSLGTCYLAGKMVENLKQDREELIDDKDVLCVKVAALCHDLGHGPFSHSWEKFMNKANKANPANPANSGTKFRHEDMSVKMFDEIYKTLIDKFHDEELEDKDINFIKDLINPKSEPDRVNNTGRGSDKSFLYEIVSNKRTEVDVDKWDYYLRDSHSLGLNVTFEYERLMDSCRVMKVNEKNEICYRDKDADTLYEMFHTRALLHKKAYQHHTVIVIEQMLIDAFMKADEFFTIKDEEDNRYKLSKIYENLKLYTHLTDDLFNQILRSKKSNLEEARSILGRIQTRNLYKEIADKLLPAASVLITDSQKDALENEIMNKERSGDNEWVVTWSTVNYGIPFSQFLEKQTFYDKNKKDYSKSKKMKLEELSNMLPKCVCQDMMGPLQDVQSAKLQQRIDECSSMSWEVPSQTTPLTHDAVVDDPTPTCLRSSLVSPGNHVILQLEVDFLFEHEVVRLSSCTWCPPCLLVPKADGTWRLLVDHMRLLQDPVVDKLPMPLLDSDVKQQGCAQLVTQLDLSCGYPQNPLTKCAQELTVFETLDGTFEYEAQRQYAVIEKEALVLMLACGMLDTYLHGHVIVKF